MIFSPTDIYKLIDQNKFKSIRIYEGFVDDFKNCLPIDHNVFSNPQQLKERLKSYENLYDGKFTFLLGQGLKNEQIRHLKKFKVEYYKNFKQLPSEEMNGTLEYVRADEIDQKVNLLLKEKLEQREKEQEVENLKEKIKELDDFSGKLNYFLTKFLDQYLQKITASQMQGFDPNFKQYNQNGTTMNNDIDQLEKSLSIILNYLGEENAIKFAHKIETGQAENVKPIVINFINQ